LEDGSPLQDRCLHRKNT